MKLELTPLSDLIQNIRPGFASGENLTTGVVQIRMNNLDTSGNLNWEKVRRVTATANKLKTYSLAPGDVLFNCTNSPDLVGKACLFQGFHEPVVFSNHFLRIRTRQELLFPGYLSRWLVAQHPTGIFKLRSNQWVNQATLRQEYLLRLKMPLPSLSEQKRIVTILDKSDAIRRKRQQAIKLADNFLCATFLDMFGDPVTNPNKWSTIRIEEVCNLVRGSSPRPQGDSRYYGGKVPRLMVADLTRDGWLVTPQIDSLTEEGAKLSRPVEVGTVVMAVSGNVGVVSQLAVDACIHDGFVAFKNLNSDLVKEIYFMLCLHFMKTTHEKRKAGAIFQNLTTYDIKNMEIMVPNLSLQNKFCDIFKSSRFIGKKIESSIAILTELFNSLTQRAFKGEL